MKSETSPQGMARTAGLFYLLVIAAGVTGMLLRSDLIVKGDAVATAHNVVAHEALFRLAVAADMAGTISYVIVTALLYVLLRPAGRTAAIIAAFLSVAGCAAGAVSSGLQMAQLAVLSGTPFGSALSADQMAGVAYAFARAQSQVYTMAMMFFACYCAITGVLIWRSRFLPRIVGALMVFAGLGWTANTMTLLLAPALAAQLFPAIMMPGMIGEVALALWLTLRGVNSGKWQAVPAFA
ncbi:MAG: DUF4386 domain-containing protein [Alphaproteobacteria bacterium]|nr:DUF4386 domain-containing protein [Alphaproteobacteria bacterium]